MVRQLAGVRCRRLGHDGSTCLCDSIEFDRSRSVSIEVLLYVGEGGPVPVPWRAAAAPGSWVAVVVLNNAGLDTRLFACLDLWVWAPQMPSNPAIQPWMRWFGCLGDPFDRPLVPIGPCLRHRAHTHTRAESSSSRIPIRPLLARLRPSIVVHASLHHTGPNQGRHMHDRLIPYQLLQHSDRAPDRSLQFGLPSVIPPPQSRPTQGGGSKSASDPS
jgi:hypothetical protein